MSKYNPPIRIRTTTQLLQIVSSPEQWNADAFEEATAELKIRNISDKEIKIKRHLYSRKIHLEKFKIANESYSILDFLFKPIPTLFEILISWELRKDGFERKANQQQWLRPLLISLIILVIIILANE